MLSWVFGGVALFSLLLTWPSMVPFTVGALACAMLMGLGNGAVFKLVPEHFPKDTGTVTGLVGALGGLGGFFPPLLLGVFRDRLGVIWPGFLLLSRDRARAARREPARVPPGRRRMDAVAPGRGAAGARAGAGGRVGRARHGRAGRRDRRRLAQPAALRRGARRLHVRDAVCRVRHHLPLRDVAATVRRRACTGGADGRRSSRAARSARNTPSASAAARSSSSPPTATSSAAAGSAGSRTG